MKLVDLNLLIYAVNEDSPHHRLAREWWKEQLSGTEIVGLAWVVVLGFLRLVTKSPVMPHPIRVEDAIELVDGWFEQPCVQLIHPTERHWHVLRRLIGELGVAGNLATDAHLAALALEHGAELCSADPDFTRFTGVRWNNPLKSVF